MAAGYLVWGIDFVARRGHPDAIAAISMFDLEPELQPCRKPPLATDVWAPRTQFARTANRAYAVFDKSLYGGKWTLA